MSQPPYDPYGQQPPYGYYQQPPQQPPPKKRHTFRNVFLSMLALLVVLIIAIVATGSGGSSTAASTGSTGSTAPAAATSPARHRHHHKTVTYIVTGTASAQVTYGPSGSSFNGTVPLHKTARLHDVSYYDVQAQLQGGCNVSCEIKVNGKVIARSAATGGYNIADCEIGQDPLTGAWQSDN